MSGNATRQSYLWAVARRKNGAIKVRLAGPEGSHRLKPATHANALIVLPAGARTARPRTRVSVRYLAPGGAVA